MKSCLYAYAKLSFGPIGTLFKWDVSEEVLISTLPSWARHYCRLVGVEGRDSHFLSGPNLKNGQIQSNINHFALHSFPSTIVIEQTNGKRPGAGGNKKPFDNYRLRFLPRSSQHLQKPKRATSGCQHQSGHTNITVSSIHIRTATLTDATTDSHYRYTQPKTQSPVF